MKETGNGLVGDYKDSTVNGNNSTNPASQPTATTGQIDGAQSFNGTNQYVDVGSGSSLNITNNLTLSAWIRLDNDISGTIIGKGVGATGVRTYLFWKQSSNTLTFQWTDDNLLPASVASVTGIDNNLHYVVSTFSAGNAIIYVDGLARGSMSGDTSIQSSAQTYIGSSVWGGGYPKGSLDEVRISNTARSAGWIATEYNNQSQPTEFSTLGIEEVSSPAALSSFAYRKAIAIDHTKVSGATNLTNFPVLINLPTDDSLRLHAQNPSGNDILFTSSTTAWNTGTTNDKLAHEIETYTASNGSLQAWVKIPDLSRTVDTVIYMYYGNATATNQQNKTAVWDTNTKMVQHLGGNIANGVAGHLDSTQYGNNGTPNNFNSIATSTTNGTGQINGADVLDGTDDYVNAGSGSSLNITNAITIDAWIKPAGYPSGNMRIIGGSSALGGSYNLYARSANNIGFLINDGTNRRTIIWGTTSLNNWYHVVGTWAGGSAPLYVYVNGVQYTGASVDATNARSYDGVKIGMSDNALAYFDGSLDEVRISNTARSAGWIATEYNNQSQPTEFSSLGIEEVSSPSALSSFAYRKAITIDHTKVSGTTNLTNFPVLINLPTDDSLRLHAQNPSGNDILFTSSTTAWNTGTTNDKLAHEIETYTTASGSLQAWVKIPSLNSASATQDTVIYMYYGNATATSQQNKTAVWDTNTKMVQHLGGNIANGVAGHLDSTQYTNNGTPNNFNSIATSTTNGTGQINGADVFDGTDDYVNAGSGSSLNSISGSFSVGVWVKYAGVGPTGKQYWTILSKNSVGSGYISPYQLMVDAPSKNFRARIGHGTNELFLDSGINSSDGLWHQVTLVKDDTNLKALLYVDGVQKNNLSFNHATVTNNDAFYLGFWAPYNDYFNGSIDEVRISNTARSADWISTEYKNQSQPTEFSSLGIEEVSSPLALSSFAYRKAITIDRTKVSGTTNLTNFPVLINLPTDDSLRLHAQNPSGNDILFTSSTTAWNTGTTNDKLAHEIETYTASNGSLQAWVKIPQLSPTVDTVIYMYYGNASIASQQSKTAVWDTNTKMVQHMNQNPGGTIPQMKDSTQYANNGTSVGTMTSANSVTGQVDGATSFDGVDDYVNAGNGNSLDIASDFTYSTWVKFNNLNYTNNTGTLVSLGGKGVPDQAAPNYGWYINYDNRSNGSSFNYTCFGNSAGGWDGGGNNFSAYHYTFSNGIFYNISVTIASSNQAKLYIDGQQLGTTKTLSNLRLSDISRSLTLGANLSGIPLFGSLDEVRISNTARSAGWIATEYNNQFIPLKTESTPAGFLALGAENIYRLEITGSATQTASVSQPITLTAKDATGNTMTGFSGDKSLTLGGASASPNNTNPTCSDKNAADIPFGTPTTLNFVSGVATCNMKLYKVETANVTATGISTVTTNLSVTVSPNTLANFLVDVPASGNSGTAFATDITSRDAYNNTTRTVSGATALSVNQGGTIAPTSISAGDFTDDGIWSGNLTITNITENPSVAITATNDIYTGADSISILGIPTTPQNASATRNTDDSMTLTWQDSSTVETGYKIERRDNTGSGFGAYVQIGIVAANISIFTDNTPYPDRSYQYRVRAYNSIGNSAAYAEDSIIHYTTSDMPSNVFGSFVSDTNFNINYTDQADVTDTHRIQRCSNANCSDTFETDLGTFTTSPQTDTTSIYPDSRYRWQVRAEAPSITSNYEVSDFEYTTPSAPIIQNTAFVSNTQLNVNWTDSSSYEDGFRIEVSTDGGAYQEITSNTNTVGAGVVSYAYTSIADHNYKFKVRAHIGFTPHNAELFSAYSAESSTVYTTSNSPTMQTPVVTSPTSILWNWTDTSAFEELFHLHFTTGSGTDVSNIPADTNSYETTSLTPNTKYSTHIHSYRSDTGESDPSADSEEIYTFANIPSNLTLTPDSQDQITAHWNANQNPTGTKYYIENINTGANSAWTADTSWASNNLMCGTEYSFRIKARNESSIETSYSSIATIKTINCSPGLPIGSADPPQVPVATPDNPMGSFDISINDGSKYTNQTNVKLTFLAGADTTRMAISNSADFSQASIIPYAKEGRWDISANAQDRQGSFGVPQDDGTAQDDGNLDGTYTVYAKFYTQYGIASQTVSDSIILDTTPPTLIINNFKAKYLTTDNIIIQGTTEPNTKVIYNLDSQRAGVIDIGTDGKLTLILGTLTAGTHSLKLITQDQLGNSSDTMQFFLNVEKPIVIIPSIPTTPTRPTTPVSPTPTNPTNPTSPITPSRPTNPITPTTPSHPTIPSNPTTQPGTTTPTQPGINVPSTGTPTTNNPDLNTPDLNNPSTNNPDICANNVTPEAPVSMQGSWNLLSLKPSSKDITIADIQMIIEKFPEFKETFQNLGLTDFSDAERLKNVSFNIPSLNEVMGLNPSNLTALNLPNTNTPLSELSSSFKKEIPSNIVFVKTKENGIDVNSALSFEDGNPNQKINLLSGQSFELVLRPDQDVNSIQGYITFKESKLSRTDNKTIIEKVANLFNLSKSALADQDIEEKLVLSQFEYQDDDKDGLWTANIQTPQVSGEYELITVLNYKDICLGSKTLRLITVVDPEGYVYRTEVDGEKTRISNATVSIYWFNSETKKYELWDAGKYQQQNPQTTDDRGTYSFLVPPGSYYLKAEVAGYAAYQSDSFDVAVGSGVHMNLEIKKQMDWIDSLTWERLLLVVFGIGLFYNFYSDRKARRKLKVKEII